MQPPPNTVTNSQGFTKVLNTGQLLRKIASRACVGKRARDNALARAALSQDSDNAVEFIRTAVENLQSTSRLTPDNYYKTILDVVLDWIDSSPNGRELNRRVEIHHHHHGEASTNAQPPPRRSSADNKPADENKISQPTEAKVDDPDRKQKKRIRVRFATFALRDTQAAPWKCPYLKPDCSVCQHLWQRRFRCNKSTCQKKHLAGAHVDINRAEEKFIRSRHPEFKEERAQRAASASSPAAASIADEESDHGDNNIIVPAVEGLTLNPDEVGADLPCSEKHTLDWASEVEEKRMRV